MKIVNKVVARPLDACWRVFTDPTSMSSWVPGLIRAELLRSRPDGLPEELRFEYASELVYRLTYTYDLDAHVVRWEPVEAQAGGVRGFARFAAVDGGTEITYALEHEAGRKAAERMLDDPNMLVEAFARRMHGH